MKILFINLCDIEGGAAMIMQRLANGLAKLYNTENYLVVGQKKLNNPNIFCTKANNWQRFFEKTLDRVTKKLGFMYQAFPYSTAYIMKKVEELKPDIIHLHNTHGGYFKTALIPELAKKAPLVWTLHDMWSFMVNAAYSFGDLSWKDLKSPDWEKKIYPRIGINWNNFLLKQKRRIYKKADFNVVCPSEWLTKFARMTPVFKGKTVTHIFNGLDLNHYKPAKKEQLRKQLGLPLEKKIIVTIAAQILDNQFKADKPLLEIFKSIDQLLTEKISIVIIGAGTLPNNLNLKNINFIQPGYLNSEEEIANYLGAANIMIHAPKDDNLPNVLVESIACGTPCMTFNVGGCGEIIKDEINGHVIPPFDIELYAKKTVNLLKNIEKLKNMQIAARNYAKENFSLKQMADAYYNLYEKLLEKNN